MTKQTLQTATLPVGSALEGPAYDYTDCFSADFTDNANTANALAAGKAFLGAAPAWVGRLFTLRNRLVKRLGLKTSETPANHKELLEQFQGNVGDKLGFFHVFAHQENEMILGEDDRHLNFRVSLYISGHGPQKTLSVSTVVSYHNWMGKAYFVPVRPFHRLIVPAMVKGMVRKLEN